jgi:transposase-like protein
MAINCPHCGSDGDHQVFGVDYWGDDELRCADCGGDWSDPSRYEDNPHILMSSKTNKAEWLQFGKLLRKARGES